MKRREVLGYGLAGAFSVASWTHLRAEAALEAEFAGLDRTGRFDTSQAINRALQSGSVLLPPGRYLVQDTLRIGSGRRLRGTSDTILIKASPPDMPLVWVDGGTDIIVSDLQLVNGSKVTRVVELGLVNRRIQLEVPMAWKYPGVNVRVGARDGTKRTLQYVRDFIYRREGASGWIEPVSEGGWGSGEVLEYSVVPSLVPLIALENARRVSLSGLKLIDGSVVYHSLSEIQADLVVSDCHFLNGQLRIQSDSNTVPPFSDQAVSSSVFQGPRGIWIAGNRFEGPLRGSDMPRYLRFTERVHGIVLAGGTRNFELVGNQVTGSAGDGLLLQCCADGRVEGNTIIGNGLSGIGLENARVKRSQRIDIYKNASSQNWFDGVDLNYGVPQWMNCSELAKADRGELAQHRIVDNLFNANGIDMPEQSGGCGIFVGWARDSWIEGNDCSNNNVSGILCSLSSKLTVARNRLAGNGRTRRRTSSTGAGIACTGVTETVLRDNTFEAGSTNQLPVRRTSWTGRCRSGLVSVKNTVE